MVKVISFDLWITLIKRNLRFAEEKCELIRGCFSVELSNDEIFMGFLRADKILDSIQEELQIQPPLPIAYAIVLNELSVRDLTQEKLWAFIEAYHRLFLDFPPVLHDDVSLLIGRLKARSIKLFIISNTILIPGEVLKSFLRTTVLDTIDAYFSDTHFCKPDPRAFTSLVPKPDIHVGDSPTADGGCQLAEIPFYQVRTNGKSLMDFWGYIEARL